MTFDEFNAVNRDAAGMVLTPSERLQRAYAREAYREAFPMRAGDSYIAHRDAATRYANYQIANQRGWAHVSQLLGYE